MSYELYDMGWLASSWDVIRDFETTYNVLPEMRSFASKR